MFTRRCTENVAWAKAKIGADGLPTETTVPAKLKLLLFDAVCSLRLEGFNGKEFRTGMAMVTY